MSLPGDEACLINKIKENKIKNTHVYILGTSCFRPIETHQVIVPNATPTLCQSTADMSTPDIEVEMYLSDDSHAVDDRLTSDFYILWKESGLPGFPVQVSYWTMYCRNDSATGDSAVGESFVSC